MDRHLQQKLEQYSATPPEGTWTKIVDALDADSGYAARLLQYESEPPAHLWSTIEANLEQEATPAKVIPFTTRFRRPMRYAAVACFLAVILVTVTLTVKRTEAGAIEAYSETTVPTTKQGVANTLPVPTSPADSLTVSVQQNNSNRQATQQPDKKDNSPVTASTETPSTSATAAFSSDNDYVLFSDGDGKLRKVSRKLAGFVNCRDNDFECKKRLQQIQQKIAASVITTDFTGLVESLRQLQ